MKILLYLFVPILLLIGCSKAADETLVLLVADHRVNCTGAAPQQCLLIREKETDNWQYLYSGIEGFEYQEGFSYRIEVVVKNVSNPPADGSSKRYILKRVISKQ